MPYVKTNNYRDIPFSTETPKNEFYTYSNVVDLAEQSEKHKEAMFNCRTVGILQNSQGRFFLADVIKPTGGPMIQVSVVYLKSPLASVVIPYPVQIFGTLCWKNRPVIYAKILQEISTPMAIRMRDTMNAVTSSHLAKFPNDDVLDLT